MRISYGGGHIDLQIPENNLRDFIFPKQADSTTDIAPTIEQAMTKAEVQLGEIAGSKRVTLIVADPTRDQPHGEMARATLRRLKSAARVRIIIATGSHKADTEDNRQLTSQLETIAREEGAPLDSIMVHDCQTASFDSVGTTAAGTPVMINSFANDCDLFVVNSDMKPHYFAGYSNGLKFFLPGVSSYKAIENNHSLALDRNATAGLHPLHPDRERRANPLAADMLDFYHSATADRPVYGVVTIASRKEISWAGAGLLPETISRGIAAVDKIMVLSVTPAERIIVSCGGYPNDETLYTAQRALELTRSAYTEGAEVLFLAECRNGIGSTESMIRNFYDRLAAPLPEITSTIEKEYILYAHKAYKLATLLAETGKLYLHSSLPENEVGAIHLIPAPAPQAVVDRWLAEDPETEILIFDKANKLALR